MAQYFRIGGFATTTVTDIIVLNAAVGTTGQVSTFRKTFTAAGYVATSGKTLYCAKMFLSVQNNNSSVDAIGLGYADNDVGINTTTARTNPVDVIGRPEQTTAVLVGGLGFNPAAAVPLVGGQYQFNPFDNQIFPLAAAGKYPYMKYVGTTGTNPSLILWCFEVTN